MTKKTPNATKLPPARQKELLEILETRFEKHPKRHAGIGWDDVQARLEANLEKLWSLNEMETTGGEPDVVGRDAKSGRYIFTDCSEQSPKGRRSAQAPGRWDGSGRTRKALHRRASAPKSRHRPRLRSPRLRGAWDRGLCRHAVR